MTEELAYKINIDVYQGPFDLLLKGIDAGEIDIYKISIAQIVSSYFEYWKQEGPNLVLAADFVYLAAYLVELKSKSILPAKEEILQEELLVDIEESLVSHIQEYEIYKNLAKILRERKQVFEKAYGRHEGEPQEKEIELVDVSLRDLVLAFKKAYDEAAKRESVVPIEAEELTLEDRIIEIKKMLSGRRVGVPFGDIFIRRTRIEIVVTFLAILELAKQRFIRITQSCRFGSILIFAVGIYDNEYGVATVQN